MTSSLSMQSPSPNGISVCSLARKSRTLDTLILTRTYVGHGNPEIYQLAILTARGNTASNVREVVLSQGHPRETTGGIRKRTCGGWTRRIESGGERTRTKYPRLNVSSLRLNKVWCRKRSGRTKKSATPRTLKKKLLEYIR